jgi:hypothetical protein
VYNGKPPEAGILEPALSQKVLNHSPDGFQWGFTGSGPAQLALALLLDAGLDDETAQRLHQKFKFDYVARFGDNWTLKRSDIHKWVALQRIQKQITVQEAIDNAPVKGWG